MNVLEKILEEILQYRKDNSVLAGKQVMAIEEIIRSHMGEKEKVTSAEIISKNIDGKPYYEIKYKKVGEDNYTVGYSSYKLDYVVNWLNECFEFCGEAKVSIGYGKDTNVPRNNGWIPVEERLPDAGNGKYYPLLNVATSYGAVKCGFYRVRDKQWYIYKEIYNEFVEARDKEIVAWQYFPESYKAK